MIALSVANDDSLPPLPCFSPRFWCPMRKLKPLLFGTILGGGIVFVALQYHLVRSDEGFRLVPRSHQPSIGLAYVDVIGWSAEDWADRPEVATAVIQDGSTDLIATSVQSGLTDALAPEGSVLDNLRGLMRETESSFSAGAPSDSPGFLSIPQDDRAPADSKDLFSIPFPPLEARRKSSETTAARDNAKSLRPTNVARNDLPSIDEILGSGANSVQPIPQPDNEPVDAGRKLPSSFDPVQETEALEDLLFGSDTRRGPAEPEVSTRDESSGMFEDITAEVQQRAQQTLGRVESGVQNETQRTMEDAADSVGRMLQDRVAKAVPDTVSSMFRGDLPTTTKSATPPKAEPLYKAIQNGFDPFIR